MLILGAVLLGASLRSELAGGEWGSDEASETLHAQLGTSKMCVWIVRKASSGLLQVRSVWPGFAND